MADHERTFRSSYGLWGPTYSISVYTIAVIFLCWGSSDSIGVTIAVFFGIIAISMVYFYFISRKHIVLDEDEKKSIIISMDLEAILRTEHGFSYLEKHCQKEMNTVSLYCLRELRDIRGIDNRDIALLLVKEFAIKYVLY